MSEIICNTSPLQYLHQLGLLDVVSKIVRPGLLLDAKQAGLVPVLTPLLDQLQRLRFRLAPHTRAAVLKLAGE